MNEFYLAVSNLLTELRCDSKEREYAIETEEWVQAEKELKKIQKNAEEHLTKMKDGEKEFWRDYLTCLDMFHFEEEQKSYYQGLMDGIQLLGGWGLIKKNGNFWNIIEKYTK